MDGQPLSFAQFENDRLPLVLGLSDAVEARDGFHTVGENRDVTGELKHPVGRHAALYREAVFALPALPHRLVLGAAVETLRCGVEHEGGIRGKTGEVGVPTVVGKVGDDRVSRGEGVGLGGVCDCVSVGGGVCSDGCSLVDVVTGDEATAASLTVTGSMLQPRERGEALGRRRKHVARG